MKLAATHLAQTWGREDLAAWENEGGATMSPPTANRQLPEAAQWPPASVLDQRADPAPRGADKGITHTLSGGPSGFTTATRPSLGRLWHFLGRGRGE